MDIQSVSILSLLQYCSNILMLYFFWYSFNIYVEYFLKVKLLYQRVCT